METPTPSAQTPSAPASGPADLPAFDVQIGAIGWYRDYDQALAVARRLGRPLWLHFGEHPG